MQLSGENWLGFNSNLTGYSVFKSDSNRIEEDGVI